MANDGLTTASSVTKRQSSSRHDWATPWSIVRKLEDDLQLRFTLDPCCCYDTAKAPRFYTTADNGISQSWAGETVFMNPPFGGSLRKWLAKACQETRQPDTAVVGLFPPRTDTGAWYEYVLRRACRLLFVRGRIGFEVDGIPTDQNTFPSVVVLWQYGHQGPPVVGSWERPGPAKGDLI